MATKYANVFALASSGDLSTKEGYAIKSDTSGLAAVQASAGANYIGVLIANPALPTSTAQAASIAGKGSVLPVVAGAAVTRGDFLGLDSSGRFITYSSGVYVGQALQTATAAGQLFEAVIF